MPTKFVKYMFKNKYFLNIKKFFEMHIFRTLLKYYKESAIVGAFRILWDKLVIYKLFGYSKAIFKNSIRFLQNIPKRIKKLFF